MFRWAVICLVISLIAGGLGLTNVSVFVKRVSLIFFALFFLGFLALVGFAYLVISALYHCELVPSLVASSVLPRVECSAPVESHPPPDRGTPSPPHVLS